MTTQPRHQADRERVLQAIYDAARGSEYAIVPGPQLLDGLGLSDQELADACRYLKGEHLITSTHTSPGHLTPYYVQITHQGVSEVEQLLQVPTGGLAGHAFISYVREDAQKVDELQRILQRAGISVWRDTADIWPGQDWRLAIREAIVAGSLAFLACFSVTTERKTRSYQNEELTLAVEQMRLRPPGVPWLIPVRFDRCRIPPFDLGSGRTLDSLQCADLFGPGSQARADRLVMVIKRILEGHTTTHDVADICPPM